MDTLRHFFELPTFADEESNTRARVMYTVLIAVIILAALIAVIGLITGGAQRQIIRDYLSTLDWDKTPPGPKLPDEIIQKTLNKYEEVYQKLIS